MTQATARALVRELMNQTNSGNSNFTDSNGIDAAVSAARRAFAVVLPDEILPGLRAGDGFNATALTVTSGYASYPADFLRPLKNKVVLVTATVTFKANRIDHNRLYMLGVFGVGLITSKLYAKLSTLNFYYRETGAGIEVWPSDATAVRYPYLKLPDELSGTDNTDLPRDVEDLTILHAFERLMGTKRGDLELAKKLASDRYTDITLR